MSMLRQQGRLQTTARASMRAASALLWALANARAGQLVSLLDHARHVYMTFCCFEHMPHTACCWTKTQVGTAPVLRVQHTIRTLHFAVTIA